MAANYTNQKTDTENRNGLKCAFESCAVLLPSDEWPRKYAFEIAAFKIPKIHANRGA